MTYYPDEKKYYCNSKIDKNNKKNVSLFSIILTEKGKFYLNENGNSRLR